MKKPRPIYTPHNEDYVSLTFRESSIPKVGKGEARFKKIPGQYNGDVFAFEDGSTLEIDDDYIEHTSGSSRERTTKRLWADGELYVKHEGMRIRTIEQKLYHPNSPIIDDSHLPELLRLKYKKFSAEDIQDMIFSVLETNSEIPENLKSFTEFMVPKPAKISAPTPEMS